MATSATEAKIDTAKAEAAAEKAYAAAAAQTEAKAVVDAKPATTAPAAAKAADAPATKNVPAKPVVAAKAAKPAAKKVAKPGARKVAKAAPAKVAAKVAVKKSAKVAAAKPVAAKPTTLSQFKDTIMTKISTEDFTAKIQEAATEAQGRAKLAFEKSQALFGEAGEFTKGNVEALVESGKILAAGLQEIGKDYVAEGKTAIETVQADFKQFAAVKSPTDFFKLQGEIMRRNFDAAVATGSKHSEKVVKLANDAFAPISSRVSLAVEKVKQAA